MAFADWNLMKGAELANADPTFDRGRVLLSKFGCLLRTAPEPGIVL